MLHPNTSVFVANGIFAPAAAAAAALRHPFRKAFSLPTHVWLLNASPKCICLGVTGLEGSSRARGRQRGSPGGHCLSRQTTAASKIGALLPGKDTPPPPPVLGRGPAFPVPLPNVGWLWALGEVCLPPRETEALPLKASCLCWHAFKAQFISWRLLVFGWFSC